MKKGACVVFLLGLFAIQMVAGKHHDPSSTYPWIYIEPLNTGLSTYEGAIDLRKTMTELHVPVRYGDKTDARYVLRYEATDYKSCSETTVESVPGITGMGAIVCAKWRYGMNMTKVNLVDATTQEVIWSYDLTHKSIGDAAKQLKHFLEKENKQ